MIKEGAQWIATLQFEDIPDRVVLKAKLQILSFLASALAGNDSEATLLLKRFNIGEGKATSLLLPVNKRNLVEAIFKNTTLSMAHDYDDYTFLAHTGHSAVGASLAICEEKALSGRHLIKGVVIGNELEGRIGASVVLGPLNGQMVAHIHSAGASAIFSALLNRGSYPVEKGIILALSVPPRTLLPSFMWGDTKLLTASLPVVQGVFCGMMAQDADVSENVLYGDGGFFSRFSFLPLYSMLTGWGKVWTTNAVSYKIYPGCAYIDSAIDCMMRVMSKFKSEKGREMREGDIEEIIVETTILSWIMEKHSARFRGEDISPVNINFSISLSLALLISRGEISSSVLKKNVLKECEEEILSLAGRIKVKHEPRMTARMVERMMNAVNFLSLPDVKLKGLIRAFHNLRKEHGSYLSLKDGLRLLMTLKRLVAFMRIPHKIRDLSETSLDEFPSPFSARVVVRTKTDVYEEYQEDPLGSAGRPMDETERFIKYKFLKEASRVGSEFAQNVVEKVMSLEKIEDVRELVK